uniref:XRE family transcriptional regulator n=1 Tax=Planktothricoides sp. SpSt-374 TaxID=2282167 RepID=A0A7C3ZJW2_9CYAN
MPEHKLKKNRRLTQVGLIHLGRYLRWLRYFRGWTSVHDLGQHIATQESVLLSERGKELYIDPELVPGISGPQINRIEGGKITRLAIDQLLLLMDVLDPINPQTNHPMTLEDLLDIATGERSIEVPPISND